ncbi:hypothetical protein J4430_03255 [Candidatus Woesearchaeota archaeon]|nr:hypothetical protein [Candidatus Woesearchaeota archaeon]
MAKESVAPVQEVVRFLVEKSKQADKNAEPYFQVSRNQDFARISRLAEMTKDGPLKRK